MRNCDIYINSSLYLRTKVYFYNSIDLFKRSFSSTNEMIITDITHPFVCILLQVNKNCVIGQLYCYDGDKSIFFE